jgi:zinc transport system substrate-binding protein
MPMRRAKGVAGLPGLAVAILIATFAGLSAPAAARSASDSKVLVTIKPLHALVAQVMAGVGSPELLVKGAASPHTFTLRPSEVRALNAADLFFRMSETVEPFTVQLVKALPKSVEVVTLQDAPGVRLLALRTGATFEPHAHGRHGHDKHQHAPAPRKGETIDGHAWLNPDNAKAMVGRIEQALAARYPDHAAMFGRNAEALRARLDALAAELDAELGPLTDKPYIVFHDALQYLERRYGLNVVGSITINPEMPPSGKRLRELRRKILSLGAVCVFVEPAVDTRLVDNLIEGTSARTATLDPEGGRLDPGPDLYVTLMRRLAADLRGCLVPQT